VPETRLRLLRVSTRVPDLQEQVVMLLSSWLHRAGRHRRALNRTGKLKSHAVAETLEKRTLLTAPNPFDLTTLDGTTGFRIQSDQQLANLGGTVSPAGDVNGDGFEDVIVGASRFDAGQTNTGISAVVFGEAGGFPAILRLNDLDGTNGFRIPGPGQAAGGGDINGDGFGDLLIAAAPSGQARTIHVLFGHAGAFPADFDPSSLDGMNGFQLDSMSTQSQRLAVAGDVNGDGFDDVIIGGASRYNSSPPDMATVLFGASSFNAVEDLTQVDGTNGFRVTGTVTDDLGTSVSGAGDINGDGLDDILIGAPNALIDSQSVGAAYVIFGRSDGFVAETNVSSLDGTNGFTFTGLPGDFRETGVLIGPAGDVNGDGLTDIAINRHFVETHILFGRPHLFPAELDRSVLDGTSGFTVLHPNTNNSRRSRTVGDINGDGLDDLRIQNHIVFGRQGAFPVTIDTDDLDGTDGFEFEVMDFLASDVTTAGDVNGDGIDDFIAGENFANVDGIRGSGVTFLVFGQDFAGGAQTGGSANDTLTASLGAAAADRLFGGVGNDALISDGVRTC
jgi:hypothetical protein